MEQLKKKLQNAEIVRFDLLKKICGDYLQWWQMTRGDCGWCDGRTVTHKLECTGCTFEIMQNYTCNSGGSHEGGALLIHEIFHIKYATRFLDDCTWLVDPGEAPRKCFSRSRSNRNVLHTTDHAF